MRAGTAAAHARIDALFSRFDLQDRASYAAFLGAHAEALLPIETRLAEVGAERVFPGWDEGRRGELLRADCAEAGIDLAETPAPLASTGAAIAGTLYVLEGSRLGAKVLARRANPGFPRRFLDAGESPGAWQSLLSRIDAMLEDNRAMDDALSAAHDCFGAFERSGERWLAA
ncbi:MAG: biliverdin-producing heme oxygenase [Sphingomonas sp.]|nr:biliverdin-producing heme oxygenase [Sphingomonas sp.]